MSASRDALDLNSILAAFDPGLPVTDRELITRAYQFAERAHEGQTRSSGQPYFIHCVAVAQLLADLHLDSAVIAAGLLHDTIEDTPITLEDLAHAFNTEVARLVDGVTKLDNIPQSSRTAKDGRRRRNREAEYLRKTLLAMDDDVRVVLIKLADRLHNMRTLGHLSEERQQRNARETLDIFAPLANRLGIWSMKWQLEDLSFRYLEPEHYREIASALNEQRDDLERYMTEVTARLKTSLEHAGIQAEVTTRPKHIRSIYQKMERKQLAFDQIYDVRGVRIIVETVSECYHALGIVHSMFRPIVGEFDDYIAAPKDNFYQSLHTAMVDDTTGKTLEAQIRTREMHAHAEYGVAAHWRYKESYGKRDETYERRIAHLRRLMSDVRPTEDADDFVEAMKSEVFQNRVYAFTPQGDIIDLKQGSTPVDFAYHIHTEIGHRCRGAKVDGKLVPLNYQLKTGQRVEIITTNRGGPSLDWLNENLGYVKTKRAHDKVRHWLRKQDRDKRIVQGRDAVDHGIKQLDPKEKIAYDDIALALDFDDVDDLFASIGFGDTSIQRVSSAIVAIEQELHPEEESLPTVIETTDGRPVEFSDGIEVMGTAGLLVFLARCCNPAPGDEILGFTTRGRGVTVHRADCPNVNVGHDSERLIAVSWRHRELEEFFPVPILITADDRKGLMRDIGDLIANERINMSNVTITTKDGVATFLMTMQIANVNQLTRVLTRLEQISGVIEARRRAVV